MVKAGNKRVQVTLSEDNIKKLRYLANYHGVSASAFINDFVSKEFNNLLTFFVDMGLDDMVDDIKKSGINDLPDEIKYSGLFDF